MHILQGTRYCSTAAGILILCLTIQTVLLFANPDRPKKSESNFFSSIARLQTGIAPLPRIMLLGSSMTGRLPDRAMGWEKVANLGCDGGSAVTVLRAIADCKFPAPEAVIIEANTLVMGLKSQQSEIDEAIDSSWFWLGVRFPQVGAIGRPASIAYSQLLARRLGSYVKTSRPANTPVPPATAWHTVLLLSPEAENTAARLCDLFNRVRSRSVKIAIVQLPCRREQRTDWIDIVREVSRRTGAAFIDAANRLPAGSLRFTDDVHMDAATASLCLDYILAACPCLD
jgi:hypothetical protein